MSLEIVPAAGKPMPVQRPAATFIPLVISPSALRNGVRWMGGPGTGKTRGLALTMVWPHLWRVLPTIVLDPTGALCNLVLHKVASFQGVSQRRLWPRIKYVDLAATDYIVPMPLYQRRQDETLFAVANRFVQVIERQDPYLQTASIEGLNALKEAGIAGGMLMAALGLQVTELGSLLAEPEAWLGRLQEVQKAHPELRRAVKFFRTFAKLKPDLQQRKAGSLLAKLLPFLADPLLQAAFAASGPGIDWAEEVRQRRTVLLDFGGETDRTRRQFKLIWCFLDILEFLQRRGTAGREDPVLLVVDEISSLLGPRAGDRSVLGEDLHELVTRWARNLGVKLCFAHQYPSQLEPTINHALTQMGTQVIGNVQDPDDALYLARQFHRYEPYLVKKRVPVWMSVQQGFHYSQPQVIDETTTEFTPEEQYILVADRIRSLPKFQFLLRPAEGEGSLTGRLRRMSIARLDAGLYPDEEVVAEVKRRLRQRDGVPVATLLAAIEQRRQEQLTVAPKQRTRENAKLTEGTPHAPNKPDRLPGEQQPQTGQAGTQGPWQGKFWE